MKSFLQFTLLWKIISRPQTKCLVTQICEPMTFSILANNKNKTKFKPNFGQKQNIIFNCVIEVWNVCVEVECQE